MKNKRNKLLAIFSVLVVAIVILGTCQEALPGARAAPFLGAPTNPGMTNLAACWDLNEESGTRYDYTDNNNDLTDTNTVLYGSGISGNAADFETDNLETLSIADNSFLSMGDIDVTMAIWVKLESKTAVRYFLYKYSTSANREYRLFYDLATDKFTWHISPDGTNVRGLAATTFGSPSVDTWYFIVIQYSAANDTMYISVNNGTQDTATLQAGGIYDGTTTFYLAQTSYDGLADTTTIYKRFLTADELTWLYNSGAGRSCGDLNPPTPTNTRTITNTFTITHTPTETFTPSLTFTATDTPTFTLTPSLTFTHTFTPSLTFTVTDTPTFTLTPSLTFTVTDTLTPTETVTETSTRTFTVTRTPTRTINPTEISATEAWEATYTAAIPGYVASAEDSAPLVAVVASLCGILVLAGLVILAIYVTSKKRRT